MVYQSYHVCMYVFLGQYMPRVGSRQVSLNKLIRFTLLCYLLCSGDKMYSSHMRGVDLSDQRITTCLLNAL